MGTAYLNELVLEGGERSEMERAADEVDAAGLLPGTPHRVWHGEQSGIHGSRLRLDVLTLGKPLVAAELAGWLAERRFSGTALNAFAGMEVTPVIQALIDSGLPFRPGAALPTAGAYLLRMDHSGRASLAPGYDCPAEWTVGVGTDSSEGEAR